MSIGRWRAFPPRTIVEAKQSALGCRAITQVRALTVAGQLYVNYAHDIHWNESTGTAEIYVGREWIALTRLGLESWATEEGLNILNPDNTVTLCADASDGDTPIFGMAPVGGGGSGGLDAVLNTDDEILIDEVMHYLSEMRTSEMDDMSIHTLLAVGAFLMSPHNQSLRRAAVEAADRFFGSFVPGGSGGGGGDDKRILVPTLEVSATHLRDGYVLTYIQIPVETLLKLVPELGEKRRALWKLGGVSPEFYVSFRVAIYDADAYDESSMFVEIDECGGGAT